ncbi:MAG TPA: winged helix-turn-helix domain-containing protein [Solirubrobacterales bacterium]|nr:winged helix-turn-helix domain-containing protein [Solirubrobacterales bacterium]
MTKTAVAQETQERGHQLMRALAHPHRVEALHILNRRMASPKELSAAVDCSVSAMAYHVRELEKAGMVELVREEPRRGSTEHFYRGTGQAIFSEDEWVQLPEPIRAAVVGVELKLTGRLLSESLASGAFEKRASRHHSLHESLVDEKGWNDAMAVLTEAMERIIEIETESAERRLKSGEAGIPLAVSLLGFERGAE